MLEIHFYPARSRSFSRGDSGNALVMSDATMYLTPASEVVTSEEILSAVTQPRNHSRKMRIFRWVRFYDAGSLTAVPENFAVV